MVCYPLLLLPVIPGIPGSNHTQACAGFARQNQPAKYPVWGGSIVKEYLINGDETIATRQSDIPGVDGYVVIATVVAVLPSIINTVC